MPRNNNIQKHTARKKTCSIKALKEKFDKYFCQYQKYLIGIKFYDTLNLKKNKKSTTCSKMQMQSYVDYINEIISRLSQATQELIKAEYVEMNTPSWWQEKYNQTTYYKVKKNAYMEFLYYVE